MNLERSWQRSFLYLDYPSFFLLTFPVGKTRLVFTISSMLTNVLQELLEAMVEAGVARVLHGGDTQSPLVQKVPFLY